MQQFPLLATVLTVEYREKLWCLTDAKIKHKSHSKEKETPKYVDLEGPKRMDTNQMRLTAVKLVSWLV